MRSVTDDVPVDTFEGVPDFPPPEDVPELDGFWRATARGTLALPFCPDCGEAQWYPLAGRPCGHIGDPAWREVSPVGTLFTFTRVERAFLPSGVSGPFTVALVELDNIPGLRLVTVLVGPGATRPEIGSRVHMSPTVFQNHTLPTFALGAVPRTETGAV